MENKRPKVKRVHNVYAYLVFSQIFTTTPTTPANRSPCGNPLC